MKSILKRVITLFTCVLLSFGLHAQSLREYVCVVRGNLSEENKTFLEKLKDSLELNGYSGYAKYIDSFLKGTFGSGFIWYADDGKPYIITNRHVVNDYESVNLSFENEDGSTSEFKNLSVKYIDEEVDFALVSLPETFKKQGLLFNNKKLLDGDDVFSAGFPGLGGEPSWQFGKGVVSNSTARIKELLNPEISTIIQHTAQIDGGNSGGPLLVKDSSAKAGYKVCGINTWRAISRQNTNFSIPVTCLNSILRSKFYKKDSDDLSSRLSAFAKKASVRDDFTCIVPFISNECVSKYGEKGLKEVLATAPSKVRSYVVDVFEESPIEGLRSALAYIVWAELDTEERIDAGEVKDEAIGKNVKILAGEKSFDSFWIKETGYWKISNFQGFKEEKEIKEKDKARNKNPEKPFELHDPYLCSLSLGYLKNFTEGNNGFYADGKITSDFFSLGISFATNKVTAALDDFGRSYASEEEYETISINNCSLSAALRLPLKFSRVCVIPYAEVQGGFSLFKNFSEYKLIPGHFDLCVGGDLSFYTKSSCSPFVGSKYMLVNYSEEYSGSIRNNCLVIYAGLKFLQN